MPKRFGYVGERFDERTLACRTGADIRRDDNEEFSVVTVAVSRA
jgi:hypothetical protein